jgi:hypothetical protein
VRIRATRRSRCHRGSPRSRNRSSSSSHRSPRRGSLRRRCRSSVRRTLGSSVAGRSRSRPVRRCRSRRTHRPSHLGRPIHCCHPVGLRNRSLLRRRPSHQRSCLPARNHCRPSTNRSCRRPRLNQPYRRLRLPDRPDCRRRTDSIRPLHKLAPRRCTRHRERVFESCESMASVWKTLRRTPCAVHDCSP